MHAIVFSCLFEVVFRQQIGICTRFDLVAALFCISADVSSRPRVTFSVFQATEELKLESDRRFRLEEALRCARICVRCGHPRVFITGNVYGFNFWHNQMSNCFFTSDNLSAGSPTHHPRELSRESSRTR